MNTVRKIKIIINNENNELRKKQYKFIRDSQYAQYQGLNRCMGYLMSGFYVNNMEIKSEEFKTWQKGVTNSANFFQEISFGKGIDSKSSITQKVKKDFSTALKNGLAKGERNINNYKGNVLLMTRGRDLKFKYDDNELDILINWVNKIQFKCVLGEHKNSLELQHTLHKVINNEYKIGQSSLYFNKKNELILILTIDIPTAKSSYEPIKDRILGVDLGMAVPVYMSINDNSYIKKSLGSYSEFAKVRKQFKERRNRLYKQLEACKGGRGRKDKLKAMNQFKEKEKNFAKTYNHFLSKNVVEFALKNKCEFIHLEKIESKGLENSVLENWTYYDLQEKIIYKAKREGIEIKFVNSSYTSQTCSKCNYVDKENRKTQVKFICKNCGFKANADYNASQNISKSKEFIK